MSSIKFVEAALCRHRNLEHGGRVPPLHMPEHGGRVPPLHIPEHGGRVPPLRSRRKG
ncbi:MAG: hypothetical protein FWF06_08780 [Symbiobacteriaceae bacterium]|nr:hypothetical protein [Symbiobacteriaceae bacterium]